MILNQKKPENFHIKKIQTAIFRPRPAFHGSAFAPLLRNWRRYNPG